jgi:hypothetical protein
MSGSLAFTQIFLLSQLMIDRLLSSHRMKTLEDNTQQANSDNDVARVQQIPIKSRREKLS